jgi:hypothetical protein
MAAVPELRLGMRRLRGMPQRSQLRRPLAVLAEQSRDAGQPAMPGLHDPVVNGYAKPLSFGERAVGQRASAHFVRLLGAEPEQTQDVLGYCVRGPRVVAIRVVAQELSES